MKTVKSKISQPPKVEYQKKKSSNLISIPIPIPSKYLSEKSNKLLNSIQFSKQQGESSQISQNPENNSNFQQNQRKKKQVPKEQEQEKEQELQQQEQEKIDSKKLYIELEKLISQKEQENSQPVQNQKNQLDFASTQKKYVKKLRETDFSLPEKLSQPNSQREGKDCLFYKFIANSQKPLKKRKDPVFTGKAMSVQQKRKEEIQNFQNQFDQKNLYNQQQRQNELFLNTSSDQIEINNQNFENKDKIRGYDEIIKQNQTCSNSLNSSECTEDQQLLLDDDGYSQIFENENYMPNKKDYQKNNLLIRVNNSSSQNITPKNNSNHDQNSSKHSYNFHNLQNNQKDKNSNELQEQNQDSRYQQNLQRQTINLANFKFQRKQNYLNSNIIGQNTYIKLLNNKSINNTPQNNNQQKSLFISINDTNQNKSSQKTKKFVQNPKIDTYDQIQSAQPYHNQKKFTYLSEMNSSQKLYGTNLSQKQVDNNSQGNLNVENEYSNEQNENQTSQINEEKIQQIPEKSQQNLTHKIQKNPLNISQISVPNFQNKNKKDSFEQQSIQYGATTKNKQSNKTVKNLQICQFQDSDKNINNKKQSSFSSYLINFNQDELSSKQQQVVIQNQTVKKSLYLQQLQSQMISDNESPSNKNDGLQFQQKSTSFQKQEDIKEIENSQINLTSLQKIHEKNEKELLLNKETSVKLHNQIHQPNKDQIINSINKIFHSKSRIQSPFQQSENNINLNKSNLSNSNKNGQSSVNINQKYSNLTPLNLNSNQIIQLKNPFSSHSITPRNNEKSPNYFQLIHSKKKISKHSSTHTQQSQTNQPNNNIYQSQNQILSQKQIQNQFLSQNLIQNRFKTKSQSQFQTQNQFQQQQSQQSKNQIQKTQSQIQIQNQNQNQSYIQSQFQIQTQSQIQSQCQNQNLKQNSNYQNLNMKFNRNLNLKQTKFISAVKSQFDINQAQTPLSGRSKKSYHGNEFMGILRQKISSPNLLMRDAVLDVSQNSQQIPIFSFAGSGEFESDGANNVFKEEQLKKELEIGIRQKKKKKVYSSLQEYYTQFYFPNEFRLKQQYFSNTKFHEKTDLFYKPFEEVIKDYLEVFATCFSDVPKCDIRVQIIQQKETTEYIYQQFLNYIKDDIEEEDFKKIRHNFEQIKKNHIHQPIKYFEKLNGYQEVQLLASKILTTIPKDIFQKEDYHTVKNNPQIMHFLIQIFRSNYDKAKFILDVFIQSNQAITYLDYSLIKFQTWKYFFLKDKQNAQQQQLEIKDVQLILQHIENFRIFMFQQNINAIKEQQDQIVQCLTKVKILKSDQYFGKFPIQLIQQFLEDFISTFMLNRQYQQFYQKYQNILTFDDILLGELKQAVLSCLPPNIENPYIQKKDIISKIYIFKLENNLIQGFDKYFKDLNDKQQFFNQLHENLNQNKELKENENGLNYCLYSMQIFIFYRPQFSAYESALITKFFQISESYISKFIKYILLFFSNNNQFAVEITNDEISNIRQLLQMSLQLI